MTRFCAVVAPTDAPDAPGDIAQMHGTPVYHERNCALGTLPDAQPHIGAGPYAVTLPDDAAPLVGLGQVTLYNRAELQKQLQLAGWPAPSDGSDGELLLRVYASYGLEGLAQVSGMFALALYDRGELLLVRDAIGARTLFYAQATDGSWAAASTIKALQRWWRLPNRLNLAAVRTYLTFAYLPGDETLFTGVHELRPGHYLRIRRDGAHECRPYSILQETAWSPDASIEMYRTRLRALVEQAVQDALPTRAPVAVFLSGGIDSSLVTALAARLHDAPVTTYAINFGPKYPHELAFAELVAMHCGTRHVVLTLSGKQVIEQLPETMARLDNPVGDPLTVPNLLLAQRAAADGFRTTLNGEGGDPCFGGPKNIPMLLFEYYRTDAEADPYARARAYMRSYRNCYDDLPVLLSQDAQAALRDALPLEELALPHLQASTMPHYLNRLMLANTRLKGAHHILTKVEKLTSSCGLEAHSPLFRRELVEYAFAIPPELKLMGTVEKWILKEAVRDLLPPLIVDRPKSGMQMPLDDWLTGSLGRAVRDYVLTPTSETYGLFQLGTLKSWLRGEHDLWQRQASKLWLILSLELWLRAHLGANHADHRQHPGGAQTLMQNGPRARDR